MTRRIRPEAAQIGAVIREARQAKGQSQAEMAEQLGVSRATVTDYERGGSMPPMRVREAVAQTYGVSRHQLGLPPIESQDARQDVVRLAIAVLRDGPEGPLRELALELLEAYTATK